MLVYSMKVFDRSISANSSNQVFTESAAGLAQALGRADKIAVQALATGVSGTSPTLFVILQDSADGINWSEKATLINGASITSGATGTADLRAYDTDVRPLLPFARLKVYLGGTTPVAHVQIFAVGRDQ